jgi:hypothetical protein
MASQGRTAKDWGKVQAKASTFARVCSYDRAGFGDSDESPQPQSADEIIGDLHTLLAAAGEKPPYLLVAHSTAGIPARLASGIPIKLMTFREVEPFNDDSISGRRSFQVIDDDGIDRQPPLLEVETHFLQAAE